MRQSWVVRWWWWWREKGTPKLKRSRRRRRRKQRKGRWNLRRGVWVGIPPGLGRGLQCTGFSLSLAACFRLRLRCPGVTARGELFDWLIDFGWSLDWWSMCHFSCMDSTCGLVTGEGLSGLVWTTCPNWVLFLFLYPFGYKYWTFRLRHGHKFFLKKTSINSQILVLEKQKKGKNDMINLPGNIISQYNYSTLQTYSNTKPMDKVLW